MDFVDCQVQGVALQAIAELGEKLTSPELLALKAQAQPTGQLAAQKKVAWNSESWLWEAEFL